MLEGSLADKILLFAIPLAITGILQQLFNAADVAVVGQFAGKDAMAAVGSNSPIIGLLVNLFVGIGLGANVVASNYTGQKNRLVVSNLKRILNQIPAEMVKVRVPHIPEYNTPNNVSKTISFLERMGVTNIDKFTYIRTNCVGRR